jgi:phosphatidylinositol glycan class O
MKSSRQHPSHKISLADWLTPLFAILGLYWFSTSFFLAKRSLPHSATCAEASLLLTDVLKLNDIEASRILEANVGDKNNGCWLPRRVDSMVILVVDALRFDFAQYNLPLSIGARIEKKQNSSSQLLQFVADVRVLTYMYSYVYMLC